jgi:hypothetical protein
VKNKKRILNAVRKKQKVTNKVRLIRRAVDFSTETLKARWVWNIVFQVPKENK